MERDHLLVTSFLLFSKRRLFVGMRVFSRLCRFVTLLTLVPTNLLMIRVLCVFCHKLSEVSESFGVPVLFPSDNPWSVFLHTHD
jgi:hypothetical protein